jgi:hypothetical protein
MLSLAAYIIGARWRFVGVIGYLADTAVQLDLRWSTQHQSHSTMYYHYGVIEPSDAHILHVIQLLYPTHSRLMRRPYYWWTIFHCSPGCSQNNKPAPVGDCIGAFKISLISHHCDSYSHCPENHFWQCFLRVWIAIMAVSTIRTPYLTTSDHTMIVARSRISVIMKQSAPYWPTSCS